MAYERALVIGWPLLSLSLHIIIIASFINIINTMRRDEEVMSEEEGRVDDEESLRLTDTPLLIILSLAILLLIFSWSLILPKVIGQLAGHYWPFSPRTSYLPQPQT
ncbi:hypothetical protein NPIL_538771 [Nephila pilipes]|uniref:Uncharacterized protein n=1 Tax=Nephila pilipes TaxID=299642 RepID=A0A8X6I9Q1_NEPPI|nr:hypothetical protein NPIL_538771 [Nephila pilipes]